jgi:hypothetical protein
MDNVSGDFSGDIKVIFQTGLSIISGLTDLIAAGICNAR